jgi:DNA polymerase-3 subunit epsilon
MQKSMICITLCITFFSAPNLPLPMTRNQAKQIIADIGGFPENDITQRTNFLVVGQQDFRVVGESGLSGKQKKALQLLQKGQKIEIMSELDFRQNI